jgi:tetratricopeptide (TPR) repeat protein
MGVICGKLGDNVRAGHFFEQAYDVFRAIGDAHGEAVSQHNIGAIHLRLGNPAKAINYHRQALHAFSAVGNEWAIGNVHRCLGDDYHALDQYENANSEYLASLHISRRLNDDQGQGATLNRLAQLAAATGHPEQAINTGLSGLDIHNRTGDRGSAAEVLYTLAVARIELRDYTKAIADAAEAARVHEQMRNTDGQAAALAALGRAYAAAGEQDHANDAWSTAADLLESLNDARAGKLKALINQPSKQQIPAPRPDVGKLARPNTITGI